VDELDLLAGARPVSPPSVETVNDARRRLTRQISAKPASRWRVRLLLPVAAGALAVSTATAIVVDTDVPRPNAPAGADSSRGPARQPDNRSAHELLLVAAEQTLRQPDAGSGKYWLSTWREGNLIQVGQPGARYAIMGHYANSQWYSAKGSVRVFETRWTGAEPASDADKAAWEKAGSPRSWPMDQGSGCPPDPDRNYTVDPAKSSKVSRSDDDFTSGRAVSRVPRAPDEPSEFDVLSERLTADQVRALPSDPAALRQWLIGIINKQNLPRSTDVELGESLFVGVQNLLFFNPITPKVRAAAYRVLAGTPGIMSLGAVRDGEGRTGVAVAITTNDTDDERRANSDGPETVSIVFNPDTGATLSFETRARGALVHYQAMMEMRWTDDEPPAASTPSGATRSTEGC
jgi:hypothetical protein